MSENKYNQKKGIERAIFIPLILSHFTSLFCDDVDRKSAASLFFQGAIFATARTPTCFVYTMKAWLLWVFLFVYISFCLPCTVWGRFGLFVLCHCLPGGVYGFVKSFALIGIKGPSLRDGPDRMGWHRRKDSRWRLTTAIALDMKEVVSKETDMLVFSGSDWCILTSYYLSFYLQQRIPNEYQQSSIVFGSVLKGFLVSFQNQFLFHIFSSWVDLERDPALNVASPPGLASVTRKSILEDQVGGCKVVGYTRSNYTRFLFPFVSSLAGYMEI